MMFDRITGFGFSRGISPQAGAGADTPQVSQILDLQDKHAAAFILLTGTIADVDATFTVLMEESAAANMSGANAVADEDLILTELSATPLFSDDDEIRKIGYRGSKRYIRLTITPALNTGTWGIGGVWMWQGHLAPVAQPT